MKKSIFLVLALVMTGMMYAERYYVMGDDRSIPLTANTTIMENTDLMLWIRDWGDQSMTCSLETSADAGPSGYSYMTFMCHPDNSGAPAAGYYGATWAVKGALDLTAITEDWKMVIVCKTDVPFWTLAVVDDTKCNLDLAAMVTTKDNQTWQTIEIPMYDIFDKGISFAEPLTTGYLFNLLTNDNTATTQLCIDAWYFTDGNDTEGVEDIENSVKAAKTIENGQIVILKNGVKFNVLGTQL